MKFPSVAGARGLQAAGSGLSSIGEMIFNLAKNRADELRQTQAMQMDQQRMGLQTRQADLQQKQYDFDLKRYGEEPLRQKNELAERHKLDLDMEDRRHRNNVSLENTRSANDMARYQEGLLDDDLEGIYSSFYAGKAPIGRTGAWAAMRQRAPNAPAGRLLGAVGRVDQRMRLDAQGPTRSNAAAAVGAGTKPTINASKAEELKRQMMKQFGMSEGEAVVKLQEKYNITGALPGGQKAPVR